MPDFNEDRAKEVLRRATSLEQERDSNFKSSWQTLANYYLPQLSNIDTEKTEGLTGWSDEIYDTTGPWAGRICATGHCNWCTPSTEPWFMWAPPANIRDEDEAAGWCARCTEIALAELARSNFYMRVLEVYYSRCYFGTGILMGEQGKQTTLNFRQRKIGTYAIAENDEGLVDTTYHRFKLSARAAAQMFGLENLGTKVAKAAADDKKLDTKFEFIHEIRPREEVERDRRRRDGANMPISSVYVGVEDKVCVKTSGFWEMPDFVTRFDSWGTDTPWGYSPAFLALPDVREANYIKRFTHAQAELRANPRILTPANLQGMVDMRPGGETTFDPNNPNALPREWLTTADLKDTNLMIEAIQKDISRSFYADIFTMLQQIDRRMTAYEIAQRVGEKLEQFSPSFDRLISELTTPLLRCVFGILYRAGKFPQAPASMFQATANGKTVALAMPEVTYTSRLALALKAMQNKATLDTMQFAAELANTTQRPEILDPFKLPQMMARYALSQGMPASDIRTPKEQLAVADARAKQMQQVQALENMKTGSEAARNMGKAPAAMQEQMGAA